MIEFTREEVIKLLLMISNFDGFLMGSYERDCEHLFNRFDYEIKMLSDKLK